MKKLDGNIVVIVVVLLLSRAVYMFNHFHSFYHSSYFMKGSFNLYSRRYGFFFPAGKSLLCPKS